MDEEVLTGFQTALIEKLKGIKRAICTEDKGFYLRDIPVSTEKLEKQWKLLNELEDFIKGKK